MFDIDELLSKKNQRLALAFLQSKRDQSGPDGILLSELQSYWKSNHERIEKKIRNGTYRPGIAKCYEITGTRGKSRQIANINAVDRLLERMLHQKLDRYLGPLFAEHSYAYQPGKSALEAAMHARECVAGGRPYVAEVDIKDYFGSVDLTILEADLAARIPNVEVMLLIESYLHREVERDGRIRRISKGLLQGSGLSPVLSNLYLTPLDVELEQMGACWLRYGDNILVYTQTQEEATNIFGAVKARVEERKLQINPQKSGVYRALDRRILGYDLFQTPDGTIEVKRHQYKPTKNYETWHASVVSQMNGVYHIIQDGIISRKDYSLLFENEDERHHIPIEITEQLNVYGNVAVAASALDTISRQNIRIAYFNPYGELTGVYTPTAHGKSAQTFLNQCRCYVDERKRLKLARSMEIASIHNMRANLRYYHKRSLNLSEHIRGLSMRIVEANECASVEKLLLIEARARKEYYEGFSAVVSRAGFGFQSRTRRPPRDEANALISFGNTVLYSLVLQAIWKTSLDPKIGIVHATNRRSFSLNLDFADIFKPVVVDRVIFSLVNRHELKKQVHFKSIDGGGVLLNDEGKRIFLQRLNEKLDTNLNSKGSRTTYRKIIANETRKYQRAIDNGEKYRPYKYY